MNEYEVSILLIRYKLNINDFKLWMKGQTIGLKNGQVDYFIRDVLKYIDIKVHKKSDMDWD
jgi:hypothetical protein